MKFLYTLKIYLSFLRHAKSISKIYNNKEFDRNRAIGEILRNTHSIEKGLSLENVRLGFGIAKIQNARRIIANYIAIGGDPDTTSISMFRDALKNYLDFHKNKKYSGSEIQKVVSVYEYLCDITSATSDHMGGTLDVVKPIYSTNEYSAFERIVHERHSIREFSHTPVDLDKIRNSIELAMRCPSACNRQCYRVYILDHSKFNLIQNWMGGTGGFDKELDKILIVTGCLSAYRAQETTQHVVTASIFAGYLTLTLQANNIGACVIQRSLYPDRIWNTVQTNLSIPGDELPVCCIGIGNLKETYKVPVSYRIPYNDIVSVV